MSFVLPWAIIIACLWKNSSNWVQWQVHGIDRKHQFLLVFHSNYGPISYHFRDKLRYLSKIEFFHTPPAFNAPSIVNLRIVNNSNVRNRFFYFGSVFFLNSDSVRNEFGSVRFRYYSYLLVVVVVVIEMNIIKVALSHFCCRTTVQSDSVSVARQVTVRRW